MNKFLKVILAILGGIDTAIYMFTPIILAAIFVNISGVNNFFNLLFYGFGLLATFFRAIKIGWKDYL